MSFIRKLALLLQIFCLVFVSNAELSAAPQHSTAMAKFSQTKNRVGHFASKALAFSHYSKHVKGVILKNGRTRLKEGGPDMPEFSSFREYESAARGFMGAKAPEGAIEGFRTIIKRDGTIQRDILRVDPKTGWFGVRGFNGTITTFFRPGTRPGELPPMQYFVNEVNRSR